MVFIHYLFIYIILHLHTQHNISFSYYYLFDYLTNLFGFVDGSATISGDLGNVYSATWAGDLVVFGLNPISETDRPELMPTVGHDFVPLAMIVHANRTRIGVDHGQIGDFDDFGSFLDDD